MPDDMLKDAIETSRRIISESDDFETQGIDLSTVNSSFRYTKHFEACLFHLFGRSRLCRENKNGVR